MKHIKRISLLALLLLLSLTFSITIMSNKKAANAASSNGLVSSKNQITNVSGLVDTTNLEGYLDENVVQSLPSEIADDDIISIIVSLGIDPIYDVYKKGYSQMEWKAFQETEEYKQLQNDIELEINKKVAYLESKNVKFTLGEKYDTLIAGFEIEIEKNQYDTVENYLHSATLILGDTYEKLETEVVTNDVNVYDTGIFDSSSLEYQGDGVVVAVLDTGLDYTHTAFSVDNFTTTKEAFTLEYVKDRISSTTASKYTQGLTAEDVYISAKVPYAYDYADKDPDVAPINSEHGTHVAGIIAGKDQTITGVAPNAQLAIFKVFSDHQTGAKTSWILSALEDCVIMNVDVINMSLGSGCGFTRETDKEQVNIIYDKVKEAGIELIASAANSYNATMGSTKNGNNGLTSNPDSGTVGAPSTYEAALSCASVDGVKTSYLKLGETIIYFNEAFTNSADETKSFVDDVLNTLGDDVQSYNFEYVVIPGIGRSSDYPDEDSFYEGKIVLVKRGTTTFEDKVRVALKEKGAAGIIIYNNVSGTISMSVGANIGAVCSVSQDDGEMLAAAVDPKTGIGHISVSRGQLAGPFMSAFSSWGPTSDLKIKPEITAHGGQIYSAVPGQKYEKLSGTSMAAPNLAGATALICQYVKYSGLFGENLSTKEVTDIMNQLMMSTTDIIYDKNGLPSAVRKQGSGLVSIDKSTTSESYLTTYDQDGNKMSKAKLEIGDDKNKTGSYTMSFDINNISQSTQTYNIGAIVLTEGVSTTYTSHSDQTVTQQSYLLSGAQIKVTSVVGGTMDGNKVSVNGRSTVTVNVEITLSDTDKKYMDESFANGMYVEGFITLDNASGVNLNVPFLGFYGDWTQAPIFDEEYYDTNKDEINKGLDDEDKLMADAYATRVIGGLYSDYITTLGSYYFVQDPKATQIAASKEHISVSNQNLGNGSSTVSSIRSVNAGLLRNAKEIYVSIVEDSTGEVVYTDLVTNQRKSFSSGSSIYASSIDIEYDIMSHNLKNNTRYTCTLTAYIDYGENEDQNNVRNTFSFPFYVDFEAPIITDVVYRTEYDKTSKKTSLYADLYVYDNHYAMGLQLGQIIEAPEGSDYKFSMNSFGKYMTPVYSQYNSTSIVTVELTDYMSQLKKSCGISYSADGSYSIDYNNNAFIVNVYDYAMNSATYEIELPDEIKYLYFNESSIKLSPNETLDLSTVLNIYPTDSWIQTLTFETVDEIIDETNEWEKKNPIVSIVNNTLVAKRSGKSTITAYGSDVNGNKISASMEVIVLAPGDEGYVGSYSIPEINKFKIDGYKTIMAYYIVNNSDREIGTTGGSYSFGDTVSLSMYPSEKVKLEYTLDSYFPEATTLKYKSSNSKIATVDENGVITAQAKGTTTILVSVYFNDQSTLYSAKVSITVKDPFQIQSIYLMSYRGLGGTVEIPADRGITTIYSYAFAGYEYVEKDLENGDVIDEEDPYYIKQSYLGNDQITKIIIPEGVTTIENYAFANLTALEEVVFPSTLTRIGVGAFYNCTSLKKINLENSQFINEKAFYNCPLEEINLSSVVSIGDYAFENCSLSYLVLPACAQSISKGAFYNNQYLASVTLKAKKVNIGTYAFAECPKIQTISINTPVVSAYAFYNCAELSDVTLGKDVAVIGEHAFSGTAVERFTINSKNTQLSTENDGALILKGTELILAAPNYIESGNKITTNAESIGQGAFAGNKKVFYLVAKNVKTIGSYAFANCSNLKTAEIPSVERIEAYAFYNTDISDLGTLEKLEYVGNYALAFSDLETLNLRDGVETGAYSFAYCQYLTTVTLGNNVTLGDYAFYCPVYSYTYENTQNFNYYNVYQYEVKDDEGNVIATNSYYRYDFTAGVISTLKTVTAGSNLTVGQGTFFGNGKLQKVTLGTGAVIGNYAFYSCASLSDIDFLMIESIGDYAFAGYRTQDFWLEDNVWRYAYEKEYNDGVFINTAYVYTTFAPCFEQADLTNVKTIGLAAFMGNTKLSTVTLSDSMTAIEDYMFSNCSSLETITLKSHVTEIKKYAFYNSGIKEISLENISTIGDGAFYNTKLRTIALKDNVEIGDFAFYYATKLKEVENQKNIKSIGANAFSLTKIETLALDNVVQIGDFAFSNSALKSITLGSKIENIGENPFLGCEIKTFGKVGDTKFGEYTVDGEVTETFKYNDTVFVEDGVLYQYVPNGIELVSYPMLKEDKEYTIKNGTVRITAAAFYGSTIESVTLSSTLTAIGDKAFYSCDSLKVVSFTSYDAPLLEETYSTSYLTYLNLPITGYFYGYEGLGISKYYMWNLTSDYTNFYFGANFKDYIGHETGDLVMVRPKNGNNYDSFIFSQYFSYILDGTFAPTKDTMNVIELISQLPSNITLSNKQQVVDAREAYSKITSVEQQSLVENLDKLIKAESTITYLESRENTNTDPTEEPVDPVKPDSGNKNKFGCKSNTMISMLPMALILTFGVIIVVGKKKEIRG